MVTVAILGGGFMGAGPRRELQGARRAGAREDVSRPARPSGPARVAGVVGADVTADLDAAIADPDVDAVDICLPTPLHREYAERALAAGKSVFLEKPIALTIEDADAIVAAAPSSDAVFMVGMVLRFWPEYVELQRLVAGRRARPAAGGLDLPALAAGRLERLDGRPLAVGRDAVDLLIHDLDQMNWLLGSRRAASTRASRRRATCTPWSSTKRRAGVAEGSMSMPRSYPFSSSIRVLCEDAVAEYGVLGGARRGRGEHRRVLLGEGPAGLPGGG